MSAFVSGQRSNPGDKCPAKVKGFMTHYTSSSYDAERLPVAMAWVAIGIGIAIGIAIAIEYRHLKADCDPDSDPERHQATK